MQLMCWVQESEGTMKDGAREAWRGKEAATPLSVSTKRSDRAPQYSLPTSRSISDAVSQHPLFAKGIGKMQICECIPVKHI
jgi:hypothetical protein